MSTTKTKFSAFLSILLAFFVMGFVDMVGTATNYAKADFALSVALMALSMAGLLFFKSHVGIYTALASQTGSVIVITAGVAYLVLLASILYKKNLNTI